MPPIATDPPPPYSYHLRNDDGSTAASFNVLVGGDRTIYGRPSIIPVWRLNEGVTETSQVGGSVDTRALQILLLTNSRGSFAQRIEALMYDDSTKTLSFPNFNTDDRSSATTSGSYTITGLERLSTPPNITRFRMTLQAISKDAVR